MLRNSLLIVALIFPLCVCAQRAVPVEKQSNKGHAQAAENASLALVYRIYDQSLKPKEGFINGREYVPYYYKSELKPLLFEGAWHTGSVTINGLRYEGVNLLYDTFTDQVIYVDSSRHLFLRLFEVALNKDNIDSFSLFYASDTLTFRYLSEAGSPGFGADPGFYEIAYDEGSRMVIRHRSTAHINDKITNYHYEPIKYVDLGHGFIRIRSKQQFIELFGADSEAVRRFISASGIRIRKSRKDDIVKVLRYYDSLR